MAYLLGVDTGGTYTDAVILDPDAAQVLGKAKALTTRSDLSQGIGAAVDAALAAAGIAAARIGMVSLSTTLATNALVEGQGGRVALVSIGFDEADLTRAGLADAMGNDPVIRLPGGHDHAGGEATPLDLAALTEALAPLAPGLRGVAVAARFATRNPSHEQAARAAIRAAFGLPVTCSHELSAGLNGPRRALTAVLNARLIGMIDRLVSACERHLAAIGIDAPLMVVRGDGALISAALVRERPIETILSGPAASIVGARWLTGARDALVSDIGGTTTDIALLKDGLPEIDPDGARVGAHRTMVEAVAMRTWGLGGNSELHVLPGLEGALRLGPRRMIPVALLAQEHPEMVHTALDRALSSDMVGEHDGRFVIPMMHAEGLPARDAALMARITHAMPVAQVLKTRLDLAALDRLVASGLVMLSGATPSDAAHVQGLANNWDAEAARKALTLIARRRDGRGMRLADGPAAMAARVVAQLHDQTVDCLMEAAFAEDPAFAGQPPEALARHLLTLRGLAAHRGTVRAEIGLNVPVIGLGASAPTWYAPLGARLGTKMILPDHAGVANAIGAVVGQVSQRLSAAVTTPTEGRFVAHLAAGNEGFASADAALDAVEAALSAEARARALAAGAAEVALSVNRDLRETEVEGRRVFIEATVTVTASGRPRIAHARDPETAV